MDVVGRKEAELFGKPFFIHRFNVIGHSLGVFGKAAYFFGKHYLTGGDMLSITGKGNNYHNLTVAVDVIVGDYNSWSGFLNFVADGGVKVNQEDIPLFDHLSCPSKISSASVSAQEKSSSREEFSIFSCESRA